MIIKTKFDGYQAGIRIYPIVSGGGGGSTDSQQSLDPELKNAFLNNLNRASGVAGGLQARRFSPFDIDQETSFNINRQFADPNSREQQRLGTAFNVANQAANFAPGMVGAQYVAAQGYGPAQADAAQMNRGLVRDVNAERIGAERVSGANVTSDALGQIAPQARQNIRDIQAGSFLNQNVQQYMNPYTQAVTDQSLKDLERSRQLQQQQTSAQATAARAFGGSRQGVAEAETNRAFGENAARLVAQQNAEAFRSAQQAAESDLGRSMQAQQLNQAQDAATTQQSLALAGQFGLANQASALTASQANQDALLRSALANQGVDVNVGQLNTQNAQQRNLANQAAINQASQFGAGAQNQASLANAQNFLQANLANQQAGLTANQQRLAASGQIANIAGQGQQMGIAGANQLAQQGAMRQQFSQQQLDAIRNLPLEQQQIINQALGLNPAGGSGQQQTSQSRQGLIGIFS
jgi:hypothetical protein